MKSFMSAQLDANVQSTKKAMNSGKECSDCNTAVRTSGQEDLASSPPPVEGNITTVTNPDKPDQVVVMQGPLGTAITEALKKSLSKDAISATVTVPNVGNENSAYDYVQANGQIFNAPALIAKISKSTGVVPETDDAPTAVNTMLDCAKKVEDIEFILINKIDPEPSHARIPQKSIVEALNGNEVIANESLVIESVQVVVTYRKGTGNNV